MNLILVLYDIRPLLPGTQDVGLGVHDLLALVVLVDPDQVDLEQLNGDEDADLAESALVGDGGLQDEPEQGVLEPVEQVAVLEVDHPYLLGDQLLHVDAVGEVEPADLLNKPVALGQLPAVAHLVDLVHLQRLHHYLRELVVDDVVLVGRVTAVEHRQHAVEDVLRDVHDRHVDDQPRAVGPLDQEVEAVVDLVQEVRGAVVGLRAQQLGEGRVPAEEREEAEGLLVQLALALLAADVELAERLVDLLVGALAGDAVGDLRERVPQAVEEAEAGGRAREDLVELPQQLAVLVVLEQKHQDAQDLVEGLAGDRVVELKLLARDVADQRLGQPLALPSPALRGGLHGPDQVLGQVLDHLVEEDARLLGVVGLVLLLRGHLDQLAHHLEVLLLRLLDGLEELLPLLLHQPVGPLVAQQLQHRLLHELLLG